jgi:Fe-S-cluster containining protein
MSQRTLSIFQRIPKGSEKMTDEERPCPFYKQGKKVCESKATAVCGVIPFTLVVNKETDHYSVKIPALWQMQEYLKIQRIKEEYGI